MKATDKEYYQQQQSLLPVGFAWNREPEGLVNKILAGLAVVWARIHNWGGAFDVRGFGGWAHRGGKIIAEDCLFTQSSGLLGFGLLNTFIDLANHVGQSVNDYGLGALFRPRTYLPGICRALTADTGGQVIATRCYRNRRWIFIDGCDPLIGRDKARAIVAHIEAACADMRPFLGTTLTDFFDTITA